MGSFFSRTPWSAFGSIPVLVISALAVSSCAMLTGERSVEDAAPSNPVEHSSDPQCGDYTARQALETWGPQVPSEGGTWDLEAADTGGYDPCAELSLITVTTGGEEPTFQVMLFRYGAYIQPAAEYAFDSEPASDRIRDDALELSWSGDSPTTAIFRWFTGEGVRVSGAVPPPRAPEPEPSESASPEPEERPSESQEPKATSQPRQVRPMAVHETPYGDYGYLVTPSENIMCEFDAAGEGGCGVLSYMDTGQYGTDELWGSRWWIYFGARGAPEIGTKGDAPVAMVTDTPGRVLEYGERAEYGAITCDSESDGLTCWNTETGHGATVNRSGYTAIRVDQ